MPGPPRTGPPAAANRLVPASGASTMYIPFRKIYRAFDELKHLSDEECEVHLRRVRLRETRLHLLPWGAVVLGVAIGLGVVALLVHSQMGLRSITVSDILGNPYVFVGVPAITLLVGLLTGLLVRDLVLLRLLRDEIHKARCPRCRQSLMGLPIQSRALGPPEPGDAVVRCTECGRKWVLFDIGLTPRDLIPWEMRGVPKDYGKVRRETAWNGRRSGL